VFGRRPLASAHRLVEDALTALRLLKEGYVVARLDPVI
jgi:hypothetical protein